VKGKSFLPPLFGKTVRIHDAEVDATMKKVKIAIFLSLKSDPEAKDNPTYYENFENIKVYAVLFRMEPL
jgi:hypothetical protein